VTPQPPALEPAEAVVRFGRALREAGYSEQALCERLGIASMFDFRGAGSRPAAADSRGAPDACALLLSLFLDGAPVRRAELESHFGAGAVAEWAALGLVGEHPTAPDSLGALALVYPVQGLLVTSDLNEDAPGASHVGGRLADDAVYPAIADANRGFLADLPRSECGRLLDLCAGTGIGGLLAAATSGQVCALDITERATRFARFNALLNGIRNLEAQAGDLWEPVAGRRFDRIVAHPPYLPSLEGDFVFRDGGPDGEQVYRRIIEGLPAHLDDGGLFYGHGMMTDRREAPLEVRLRGMLGPDQRGFDVYLLWTRVLDPETFVMERIRKGRATLREAGAHLEALRGLGVERFVQGTLVIESNGGARSPITVRRARGSSGGWNEIEALLAREHALADPDFEAELPGARPRLRRGVRVLMGYRVLEEGPGLESLRLESEGSLPAAADLPPGSAALLPAMDGTRTIRELLADGIEAGAIPEGTPIGELAGLMRSLVRAGLVELAASGAPRRADGGGAA